MLTAGITNAGVHPITTMTFVVIAIGMVCAIGIIWWGTLRRRAKAAAIAESEKHAPHPVPEEEPANLSPQIADVADLTAPAAPTTAETVEHPVQPVDSAPVTLADPEPAAGAGQPLTLLKGLGPRAATRLEALGITSVEQLAALSPAEVTTLDGKMEALTGRIARDRWIEQAKLLAAGDIAGFEAAFGKLGG